jgi:hypothetical protein
VRLADLQHVLRRSQVRAPYRGINKLPAEPVVMIFVLAGVSRGELARAGAANTVNVFQEYINVRILLTVALQQASTL